MVARVNFSGSMSSTLNYNEKKVDASAAKLLFASGFGTDAAHLSAQRKLEVFRKLSRQNTRSKASVMHVSLNFIKEDTLDSTKLIQIAGDYMRGIGFDKQPYLVYQHFDAGHPHVHLVSVAIEEGGRRMPTQRLGWEASLAVAREIDQFYGLHPMGDRHSRQNIQLETVPLHRIRYGEMSTWMAISSVVSQVEKSYNTGSLPQFNTVLNQFGIMADAGRPGSRLHANRGLIYYLLDEQGKRVGKAIKSSNIFGSPTLKLLERRFAVNEMSRGALRMRLRYHLDKALISGANQAEMETRLRAQGIRIVFNTDPEGKVFGATFIDNGARSVFNDWELGKKYHYEAFLNLARVPDKTPGPALHNAGLSQEANGLQLTRSDQVKDAAEAPGGELQEESRLYPGNELPVFEILRDHLYYDKDRYRQQRALSKKKQQRKGLELGL